MIDEQVIQEFLYRKEGKSQHIKSDGESLWAYSEADRIAYWDNEYYDLYVRIITISNPPILPILYHLCYEIGVMGLAKPEFYLILDEKIWDETKGEYFYD